MSLTFSNPSEGFVKSKEESWLSPAEIEKHHLTAIAHADFVWLHLPEGYVGTSTALEIGFALAKGVPLFSHVQPLMEPFTSLVQVYPSVFTALENQSLLLQST
ncbi:hypothetical protein BH11PAT4_BH11PAT4_1150 [soil metagenome]